MSSLESLPRGGQTSLMAEAPVELSHSKGSMLLPAPNTWPGTQWVLSKPFLDKHDISFQ
jgi:hypothetical protein